MSLGFMEWLVGMGMSLYKGEYMFTRRIGRGSSEGEGIILGAEGG